MMKRILAIIIAISMLLSIKVLNVTAAEYEFLDIYLCENEIDGTRIIPYEVIIYEEDLLFSGDDLAYITGYSYKVQNNIGIFSRGNKEVKVDIVKNILYPMKDLSSVKLISPVITEQGKYYYSGAQLLPWLNVTCMEENGIFYVVQDAVSFWDINEKFEEEKDNIFFDFEKCCNELGINSKWLKAGAYVRNNGLGAIKDILWVPFSSFTYGQYKDYYDIFEDMMKNNNSLIRAYEELEADIKIANDTLKLIEALDNIQEIPQELATIKVGSDILSGCENMIDFVIFFQVFEQDNAEKIMWVNSISGNRLNYRYPEAMTAAAFDIISAYSNKWDGIAIKSMHKLVDMSVDDLMDIATGKGMAYALLCMMELDSECKDWIEGIDNISQYNALARCGYDVYTANLGLTHIKDLELQRAHAMLYLYASECNWRTMAELAKEKGRSILAEEYTYYADLALKWQAMFLLSSQATINDSHEYKNGYTKNVYQQELLQMFKNLIVRNVKDESIELMEYAFVLQAIYSMGMEDIRWIQQDIDQDGNEEFLFFARYDSRPSLFLIDMDTKSFWSYTPTGAAGDSEFCTVEGEEGIIWKDGYYSSGTVYIGLYRWLGNEWECFSMCSAGLNETGEELVARDVYWYDEEISYEEFIERDEKKTQTLSYPNKDVFNIFLSGTMEDCLKKLEEYLHNRGNKAEYILGDIDNDDRNEYVFLLYGAANMFFSEINIEDSFYFSPLVEYYDREVTLLILDEEQEGVVIRPVRIGYGGEKIEIKDNNIMVNGVIYRYTNAENELNIPCISLQ